MRLGLTIFATDQAMAPHRLAREQVLPVLDEYAPRVGHFGSQP